MLSIGIAPLEGQKLQLEGLPEWLARLLYARGIRSDEEAQLFLHPGLDQIRSPLALPGMERALSILHAARETGKTIAVYGDYDVDGVCASAILKEAFSLCGLSCVTYLPHRHKEGYGLNTPAVEMLAKKCDLLVTVDCGITSIEEVAAARRAGMQVIVTDHHKPGDQLPDADAVISPLLQDYPFPFLCGAGVAWKLAWGLIGERAMPLLELAALATVADMVPLTGENRSIVALGLQQLSQTRRLGLRAVMESAGIKGKMTSEQIAFQIAPRMNACGRMDTAQIALDMLLTHDAVQAHTLAVRMENLNQERKSQESQVLEDALAQVAAMDLIKARGLVVMGQDWNSGVVGLAAGKIAEKYTCPTVALSREGDVCVGSARSAGDVDIHKALSQCADLFIRFGGHRQAAGLTIEYAHVPEFARRFSQAVMEQTGNRALVPQMICDGELSLAEVTAETVELLGRLEPFGMGNPAPRFLCDGVEALSLQAVGSQGKHLKCTFQQGNALRDGIFFGGGDWAGQAGAAFRMVMTPTLNEFRGRISAECQLHALQLLPENIPHDLVRETVSLLSEELFCSHPQAIGPDELDDLMQGNQGTLLVCRCLETALRLHRRFPEADFCLDSARDPKAYHTILLYGNAIATCASYRHVVLCDGSLGEASAYQAACPGALIYTLPVSEEMKKMLSGMYLDVSHLRECYRMLRAHSFRDLKAAAEEMHISEVQAAFAFKVFAMMGLIQFSFYPFAFSILPAIKASPEDNPLFRMAQQAKEEHDGVYGL
ncbi:MAG: single-stranded-DNA-specific exonuclease RecJ [Clostridia bacterium]|nr:single-stranded-DNA-specific exonuclease RecJ [Clostridia bacterium]